MQPIDVVKTRLVTDSSRGNVWSCYLDDVRFQIQGITSDPSRYTSILDCLTRMIRNEGYSTNTLFSSHSTIYILTGSFPCTRGFYLQ